MKRILLTLMLLMVVTIVSAQAVITGTVVSNNDGEPLIGATIKAGTQGTITDIDGKFTLKSNAKQVEITYIGYKPLTIKVVDGKINARLEENTITINEVVAIGYGSVKRGDITNAVAQVKGDALVDRPLTNVAAALQGELAGVDIQSTSGAPGSSVQIKVRGATSINESTSSSPLYVVDGVPMDESFDLNSINPHDIQSIEVLKDASSSAIYGSRGANGVILITSKKGDKNSRTSVNVTTNFSLSTPEKMMNIFNSSDWMIWRQMSNDNSYVYTYGNRGALAGDTYAEQVAMTGGSASTSFVSDPRWKMIGYGGLSLVDWQKAMFRTAFSQNYNLAISSGNKTSSYRASLGYTHQDGIVIHTGLNRLNAKLSTETSIKERLTLGLDLTPQMMVTTGGNVDGKDNAAMQALQLVPVVEQVAGLNTAAEPFSRYMWAGSTVSPVALMRDRSYRDEQIRLQASARAAYQVNKHLKIGALASWIFNNRERKTFTPSSLNRNWTQGEGYAAVGNWNGTRSHKYLIQATATYTRKFAKKHNFNVVVGWSAESTQDAASYTMAATQFPNNTIQGWTLTSVEPTRFDATYSTDDHLISYFGRVEYGYDSRYLINASIRRDGSSRFGLNRKWGTFPAISAAWRISNEKFWDRTWIMNQAKVRVSYGSNGSNSIPTNAADGMLTSANYAQDGTLIPGYVPLSLNNDDLGWQKTNSWNYGLDLSFFRNRISVAVDYYVKNISNMLYQVTLPSVIGYAKGWDNIGNIRTNGVEIELKTENLTGLITWTTKASVGYSTNKVTDLGENSTIYTGFDNKTQIIEVGHPVGEYYMYIADGVYRNEEDLARFPKQESSVVGSVRYRDVNGDGVINEADRTYCGKPQPSWTFGLNNSFKWNNWDMSFLITGQCGGKIWSALGRAIDMQYQGNALNRLDHYKDMWLNPDHVGNGKVPAAVGTYGSIEEQFSTRWLYSTDFIKLKNITLGYRFNFSKDAMVRSLRITASVENIFMIDNYYGGYSPESNNSGSQVRAYDYGAYPSARTFSIGCNISL